MAINSKGYFFSVDAFIGLLLVMGVVLLVQPNTSYISYEVRAQDDLLRTLSTLKVGEINNSYVKELIANETISGLELNNTILDQIGVFYALDDPIATYLSSNIIESLDLDVGVALYYDNSLIANNSPVNFTAAQKIRSSRFLVTGVMGGVNASSGFSSRAFLYSGSKIKYFYFGGYVGDGNVTVLLGENATSAKIEGDFYTNFSLYINDIYVADYNPTRGVPYEIDLSSYPSYFKIGENNLTFNSITNESFSVAGGYVRIVYGDTTFEDKVQYLPGITGFINLYDGFRVPGNLTSMNITLHYNSTYNIFMSIGSEIVYSGNSSGSPITVMIDNATLSSQLDYSSLSENTVPFRIGIVNVSDILRASDVFSVSDISGSMNENEIECGGSNKLLDCAQDAHVSFLDLLLAVEKVKVGLVGYQKDAYDADYHHLSQDHTSLNDTVNDWTPGGGSCVCCGINRAVAGLVANSTASRQSIVVMGDGKPNTKCAEQNTGSAEGDAVQAACDAYNDYGIVVYSIGFGSGVDEVVMQDIASCGQGDYYYGTVGSLTGIYETIAGDILNGSYEEQTVFGEGNPMTLYPDSKISLGYTDPVEPYGLQIISESEEFGNLISEGTFDIPSDAEAFDVGVISYSGSKWTYVVDVYNVSSGTWYETYNLTNYDSSYEDLGDPYIFSIPVSSLDTGENKIRVRTALSPTNTSGGSVYNKIIYTLIKDIASYSPVLPSANGCRWHIQFEDGSNDTLLFPSSYSGTDDCYFAEDDYFFAGSNVVLANTQDAISVAIFNLLETLDLNGNNRVETKFSESDLDLSSVEIEGLPFTVTTEVQARTWL